MIMKLQGCVQQHLCHAVCFAKDLASLQRLDAKCPICQLDIVVTIHDTDCQDGTVENGQASMIMSDVIEE